MFHFPNSSHKTRYWWAGDAFSFQRDVKVTEVTDIITFSFSFDYSLIIDMSAVCYPVTQKHQPDKIYLQEDSF